ncbi:hypothetical protein SynROS8604_00407 [Synechococcus sp. ROS8604]|nr:hypothetical protein SynROS8604_00407 [Synechococcus sp. ROS8604]
MAYPYRGRRPSVAEPLEPLQAQCAGSVDEFVPRTASVADSSMSMEMVLPSTSIQDQMPVRRCRK